MKKIILILCCLTLATAAGLAEDFHLIETTVFDDRLLPVNAPATNSIYVLLLPLYEEGKVHINPVVLKKFDGKEIGGIIGGAVSRGFLPSGSVLHIDPSPEMEPPPEAEIRALTDYCKKAGITVVVSETE